MKAGKGHAVIEERQAKQGMRARQCMKMKKYKDTCAWASNSYISIEQSTCRKWGLWSKGKPCLGSHALMPTEEYLVFGVSFFGASNSHHTHHVRATRANCASPHKQAKQASQHVARNSFWCHFCAAKTTFGGLSFRRRTSKL